MFENRSRHLTFSDSSFLTEATFATTFYYRSHILSCSNRYQLGIIFYMISHLIHYLLHVNVTPGI